MATRSEAVIRPYDHARDDKVLRFSIAKAVFGGLAVANREVYSNPIWLAVWLGLSTLMVEVMKWWPDHRWGVWGYLRPIPAYAAVFMPLIFAVDWFQRPHFDAATNATLTAADMRDPAGYYARSGTAGRGLWLLDFGDKFIGLVALDRESSDGKGNSGEGEDTATVRHLYVEEAYRSTEVQDDLLRHALGVAFGVPGVRRVVLRSDGVQRYVDECARRCALRAVDRGDAFGLRGWRPLTWEISREQWTSSSSSSAKVGS